MEDDLRTCRNRQCKRFRVIVSAWDTNGNLLRRCTECGSKLKTYNGHPNTPDQPILVDSRGRQVNFDGGDAQFDGPQPQSNGKAGLVVIPSGPLTFTSTPDVFGCPVAPSATVKIPWPLYQSWIFLAYRFKTEWAAFLTGNRDEEGIYHIDADGMVFPEQQASGGHVSIAAGEIEKTPNIIAAVHSHVAMNAFFSDEDKRHFNHPVELVINNRGDIEGVIRVKLECGRFSRTKATIKFLGGGYGDLVTSLETKLKPERTYQSTSSNSNSNIGGRFVGNDEWLSASGILYKRTKDNSWAPIENSENHYTR